MRHPMLTLLLSACLPFKGQIEEGTGCIDVDEDATDCPAPEDVDVESAFVPMDCDDRTVESVSGEGTLQDWPSQVVDSGADDLVCCYAAEVWDPDASSDCAVGRPMGALPALVGAPAEARAAAWAEAGRGEHASVAAFARLALELLAHGAPPALVQAALAAADDELRHARLCFERAGCAAGTLEIPPFAAARPLAEIASDAVREGCVAETVGAVVARAAAASEPALDGIAADEERHAVLSWQIVAWALRTGGPEVRAAVRAGFARPAPRPRLGPMQLRSGADHAALQAAADVAMSEVITPAARALLAA